MSGEQAQGWQTNSRGQQQKWRANGIYVDLFVLGWGCEWGGMIWRQLRLLIVINRCQQPRRSAASTRARLAQSQQAAMRSQWWYPQVPPWCPCPTPPIIIQNEAYITHPQEGMHSKLTGVAASRQSFGRVNLSAYIGKWAMQMLLFPMITLLPPRHSHSQTPSSVV